MDTELLWSAVAALFGLTVTAAVCFEFGMAIIAHCKRWLRNRRNFWRHVPHGSIDHTGGQFYRPARFYLPASMRDQK